MQSLDYVAGLFDGEGNISILKSKRKGRKNYQFHLQVAIANTFKPILDILQQQFKMGTVHMGNHATEKHSVGWQWRITGSDAGEFLKLLKDRLVIKKEQALVGLEFRELIVTPGTNQYSHTHEKYTDLFEKKNILYKKCAELKGKASRIYTLSVAETKQENALHIYVE